AHAMETDEFIGELMDRLEKDGHIEDTVLIFFSDHYAKYMSDTEFVMQLKGADNQDMLCKTPFFIYNAGTPAVTVTKPSSTMDIAPTIANMFGLDVNYAYYAGDDIFGEGGGCVIFKNYNWYDGDIYYSSEYEGETTEYIKHMNEQVHLRLDNAWATLQSNYFAHLSENEQDGK
ncbi:MAG: sulfatase-like hydrolase/transferase, partial [Oscillospiraceae bacterium]|nr:sulfatase-like hydrolase/transferase [Oscillospiraceae bacterium]